MKWEKAIFTPKEAEDIKGYFECGDNIGFIELRKTLRQSLLGTTEGAKLLSLIAGAEAMNPIIIQMEQGIRPFDREYDYVYRSLVEAIHEYFNKIINQEVK